MNKIEDDFPSPRELAEMSPGSYALNPVWVRGVISPAAQGGVILSRRYVKAQFELAFCGVTPDGLVRREPLTIGRAVIRGERYERDYAPYTLWNLELLLSATETHALLYSATQLEDDRELEVLAEEFARARTLETAELGTLALDRNSNVWVGEVEWAGSTASVRVHPKKNRLNIDRALSSVSRAREDEAGWRSAAERTACCGAPRCFQRHVVR